ncbi:TniQ family protein [Streptomyces sp. NPDC005125]
MTHETATLPLRTGPLPGESIDSWIEALARRHRLGPSQLLSALGLPERARSVTLLLKSTPPRTWRRMETAAGLPDRQLHANENAARKLYTLIGGSSRFCPRCLGETSGRWMLAWRSNWAVACPRHQTLLHDTCPTCHKTPRVWLPGGRIGLPPVGACSYQSRATSRRCGTDLTSLPTPQAHPDVIAVQSWLDDLHQTAEAGHEDAAATLADMPVLAPWLMAREGIDWQARADQLAPSRTPVQAAPVNGRLPWMDAALIAAVLHLARTVQGTDPHAGVAALRELSSSGPLRTGVTPAGMSAPRWRSLTSPFPNRFLRAVDPELTALDRLRFKSPTPQAARPHGRDAAERGRRIPHLLWPDWAGRLLPVTGFHPDLFRATAATCLLAPDVPARAYRALTSRFNRRVTPGHISVLLQGFGDLPAPTADHVLIAFCRIAAHLDQAACPIDYQRRREQIPSHHLLSWDQRRDLACAVGLHPGQKTRKGRSDHGRLLHAQRHLLHLLHLLTGADLGAGGHHLSFTSSADRSHYVSFTTHLTPPLRTALADHAEQILSELGIDEPVTWSPPQHLAEGLTLPGVDTTALDSDTIRHIVIDQRRSAREAAEALGIHVEHVRLALEHLDRPERDWKPRALPAVWQRRQEMARITTRDFFEREYVQGRRNLKDLSEETGYSRYLLAAAARTYGITLKKARDPTITDPDWLRDQYERQGKSTAQIAKEVGTTQMTVNRALHQLGVTARASGVHSSSQMMNRLDGRLAADLRAAVDKTIDGWQRLHRFEIAMAFPTLTTAARRLGIVPRTLVVQFQRLEDDIGGQLFHRSTPHTRQQPTKRGRQLLRNLAKDHVRALMAEHFPHDELDQLADHQAAGATEQFPVPRKPIDPSYYTSPARLRITNALVDLLNDLRNHPEDQCYGTLISIRTHRDVGNIYEQLKQLRTAGWATSSSESDESWNSRATPGRGPGRRRTYYRLTPAGQDAALREAAHLAAKPVRRRKAQTT